MPTTLSAAEIKTLQSPETEQVRVILPLLLKELVLKGWLDVRKGTRPTEKTLWALLAVVAIALFGVGPLFGAMGILVLVIAFYVSTLPKTLLSLTPEGERILQDYGPNSPLLVRALQHVAFARPDNQENCTTKEWRKYLSRQYPDNATFHSNFLLLGLKKQGLIMSKGNIAPKRTQAGNAALAKAEAEIELGGELPRLLREGSPNAAVLAASLGGLLLLVPGMEGYFYTLMNMAYLPEDGLDEARKQQSTAGNNSAPDGSSSGSEENQEDKPDTDNGMDWQSNADFLDGEIGDGNDAGIGTDSGCGVGSDGSDSSGDSGGDGCSSGCGGCGGGD